MGTLNENEHGSRDGDLAGVAAVKQGILRLFHHVEKINAPISWRRRLFNLLKPNGNYISHLL
jgi:hypothetical protein